MTTSPSSRSASPDPARPAVPIPLDMPADDAAHGSITTFPAQTSALREIRSFVQAELRQSALPAREHNKVVMAVDEAVANIIEHGYRGASDGSIGLIIETGDAAIRFIIRDTSPAFNPSSADVSAGEISTRVLAGNRRGYGLHLMRAVMDSIEYGSGPESGNDLVLTKRFANPPSGPSPS